MRKDVPNVDDRSRSPPLSYETVRQVALPHRSPFRHFDASFYLRHQWRKINGWSTWRSVVHWLPATFSFGWVEQLPLRGHWRQPCTESVSDQMQSLYKGRESWRHFAAAAAAAASVLQSLRSRSFNMVAKVCGLAVTVFVFSRCAIVDNDDRETLFTSDERRKI